MDEAGKLNLLISMHINSSLIGGRKWKMEQFFGQFFKYLQSKGLGNWRNNWESSDTGWRIQKLEKIYLQATIPKTVQEIKEAYADAMGQPAKVVKTPGYLGQCLKQSTTELRKWRTGQ